MVCFVHDMVAWAHKDRTFGRSCMQAICRMRFAVMSVICMGVGIMCLIHIGRAMIFG